MRDLFFRAIQYTYRENQALTQLEVLALLGRKFKIPFLIKRLPSKTEICFGFNPFFLLPGNNPKIEVVEDQGYMFKPPFKIRNKNGLVKLLKKRDLNGEGGVMYDEGGGNL